MPLLDIRELSVRYGGVVALDGVSLAVDAGEIVGVIGPNGAGKSTLLDAVSGVARAEGRVLCDGRDVGALPAAARVRHGLVRTFQAATLFEPMTVRENLRMAADVSQHVRRPGALAAAHAEDRVDAVASLVGVDELLALPAAAVQGTARRLVDLAAALLLRPRSLLVDEPAAGSNDVARAQISGVLRRCRDSLQLGVVLVEHDVPLVMEVADRVVALDRGAVIAVGSPAEVRLDPAVIAAYLGVADRSVDITGVAERSAHAAAR